MPKADSARRVISGTWSSVWMDGEQVGEAYGLQAKVTNDKEDVPMCGQMFTDHKVMASSGTGSLKMYKMNSRMLQLMGEKIKRGEDPRFTIISKLADPDVHGCERMALYNVSFDDLTLIDWEVRSIGKVEAPFTFTGFDPLDQLQT